MPNPATAGRMPMPSVNQIPRWKLMKSATAIVRTGAVRNGESRRNGPRLSSASTPNVSTVSSGGNCRRKTPNGFASWSTLSTCWIAVPPQRHSGPLLSRNANQYTKAICRNSAATGTDTTRIDAGRGLRPRSRSTDHHVPSGRNKLQKSSTRSSVSPPPPTIGLRHSIETTSSHTSSVISRVQ